MSRLRRELEDDLGVADEPELIAADAFDGLGVFLELLDLVLEQVDLLGQLGVFAAHLAELGLESAQAWQAVGGEHERRGSDGRDGEDEDGQAAFEEQREPGHECEGATKSSADPRGRRLF